MKSMGLNPFLRFEIEEIVRGTGAFEEIQTRQFTFPLGEWPTGMLNHLNVGAALNVTGRAETAEGWEAGP